MTVDAWLTRNGDEEIVVRVVSGANTSWACSGDDLKQIPDGLSSEDLVWDGTDSSIRLILSKRIIELHGGRLWVGGGLSQPAAFVFTLPVAGVASHSPANADDQVGSQPESIL